MEKIPSESEETPSKKSSATRRSFLAGLGAFGTTAGLPHEAAEATRLEEKSYEAGLDDLHLECAYQAT